MGNCMSDLYPCHPIAHRLGHGNVFDFPGVCFVTEDQESKSLNDRTGPAIIISFSGMCTGGCIVHHLFNRLPRPRDTLLPVGYQAEGTRGRRLRNGNQNVW